MTNPNELRAERHDHYLEAEKLIKAARAANKDLAGNELREYEQHVAAMKTLDTQIEAIANRYGTGSSTAPYPPVAVPEMTQDIEGHALPIFAKGQSIAEHMRQHQPDHSGITLGEMARAMVTGKARPEVRAALNEGTDSAGGVSVPTSLSMMLIDLLRAKSTVFQAGARTLMLDTGKATTITAVASDPVAGWRAENAAVATSDMTFSPVTMTPKCLAVIVTASRELIEDSLLLDQALYGSLAKSFAAELDRVTLIGSGSSNQPLGVANVSGIGSVSQGTNGAALTNYDPFVTALGTLQTANAADPTAVIYHPRSAQELNLLKDTQNRPLARPACLENLPFMATSKLPVNMTQGSANTASLAVMGNFVEVLVGIRHQVSIELLREKYADNYQYGFLCALRADIAVAHAASFCKVVGIL